MTFFIISQPLHTCWAVKAGYSGRPWALLGQTFIPGAPETKLTQLFGCKNALPPYFKQIGRWIYGYLCKLCKDIPILLVDKGLYSDCVLLDPSAFMSKKKLRDSTCLPWPPVFSWSSIPLLVHWISSFVFLSFPSLFLVLSLDFLCFAVEFCSIFHWVNYVSWILCI